MVNIEDERNSSPSTESDVDSQYVTTSAGSSEFHSTIGSHTDDTGAVADASIAFDIEPARNQLVAHFDGKKYDVHYMDLYANECDRVQQLFTRSSELHWPLLSVQRQNVLIDGNQLSIRRLLPLPSSPRSEAMNADAAIGGTDYIACALSNCDNVMVKYRNDFYFAGESFANEYNELMLRSKLPNGTPVRVRSERIVADSTEHILEVIQRTVDFRADQKLVVIEASGHVVPRWKSFHENGLKRYMRIPMESKLCWLPIQLIYAESDGSCDELYAEADYDDTELCSATNGSPNDKQSVAKANGAHSNGLHDAMANGNDGTLQAVTADVYAWFQQFTRDNTHGKARSYETYFVPGELRKMHDSTMILKTYAVDPILRGLMKHDFKINGDVEMCEETKRLYHKIWRLRNERSSLRLQPDNYYQLFSLILEMDDEFDRREALGYNQKDRFVDSYHDITRRFPKEQFVYTIQLAYGGDGEVLEIFEELFTRNAIFLLNISPMNYDHHGSSEDYADWLDARDYALDHNGHILSIKKDILYFATTEPLDLRVPDQLYYVHFFHNRSTYRMNRQALDYLNYHEVYDMFFPVGDFECDTESSPAPNTKWFRTNLNDEQKLAVSHIVKKVSFPLPFMLFGPPGTGKTMTIVEAIAQIVNTTNEKVLLCSSSNFACDVLTARLLDIPAVASKQCVYRLYSMSMNPQNISKRMKRVSNFYDITDEEGFYPALEFLVDFQVIICTLTTAGRLAQARISSSYPKLFSYVIIDECACATEPSAITPIAGICTSADSNTLTAQVVLAGDPKQLRPVVRCKMANELGLATSLMDRLMRDDPYRKHPITKKFNAKYIIQLLNNYRSHREILHFPSDTFYDGTIIPKALQSVVCRYINTELLPSPQIPIVFKSVQGTQKSLFKYSICNHDEVEHIVAYIRQLIGGYVMHQYNCFRGGLSHKKKLVPIAMKDIGVIASYRAQCKVMRSRFVREGWGDVNVGTVDSFQGEEKQVIIASTVRSNCQSAAFLNDPRRLNVLITRAKSLLIIVGDPFTLKHAGCWKRFLRFLQDNKAIIQSDKYFMLHGEQ